MKIKKIRKYIELVEETGIDELEVNSLFGTRIRIVRRAPETTGTGLMTPSTGVGGKHLESTVTSPTKDAGSRYTEITSPIVGTFYCKPSPDDEPYVKVGQYVEKGQVVCIIEAMKILNEIKSPFSGTIVKVEVEEGQAIEYGQTLFLIDEG